MWPGSVDRLGYTHCGALQVLELKAKSDGDGEAVVLESYMVQGMGPMVDALVRWGTLRVSDWVVAGHEIGKVKRMLGPTGDVLKEAPPSMPVRISGLRDLPPAGVDLLVVDSEAVAEAVVEGRVRQIKRQQQKIAAAKTEAERAEQRRKRNKEKQRKALERKIEFMERRRQAKLFAGEDLPAELLNIPTVPEHLLETEEEEDNGAAQVLAILKCKVHGTITAFNDALEQYPSDEVMMKLIQSGVGDVRDSEVELAATLGATIFAFDVKVPAAVKSLAEREYMWVRGWPHCAHIDGGTLFVHMWSCLFSLRRAEGAHPIVRHHLPSAGGRGRHAVRRDGAWARGARRGHCGGEASVRDD